MTAEEAYALSKSYTNQVALEDGAVLIPGPQGKNIELRNNGTYIQWRVLDESSWNNLAALSELKGGNGETPQLRMDGNVLQYKFPTQIPNTWTDLFTFSTGEIQSIPNTEIQSILNNL